ncbi:GntR family transcriptional regulator [Streptomyces mobaraensis]|uniref:GntR family transcriptional regulator n=1 Tax=Streptomyces mobaraensis TaxID=35621 RepID=UPI00332D8F88
MADSRPVYLRIADDLRRRIDDGSLTVGARIPSRSELKRAYAASDQTVDRAVRVLKAAGYAEGQFGRGVFVADRAPLGTLLRTTGAVDTPFAAEIRTVRDRHPARDPHLAWGRPPTRDPRPNGDWRPDRHQRPDPDWDRDLDRDQDGALGRDRDGALGRDRNRRPNQGDHPIRDQHPPCGHPSGGTSLTWEATSAEAPAPARIAERLGIAPGDPVLCTEYEYLADRRPVQLATSWEPLAVTGGTDVVHPERGPYARRGVRGRLAAIGVRVVQARELVGSRPATTPEAEALGCAAGQCVTVVERTHFDGDGRAVETSDLVVRADRWRLEYVIPFTG